MLHQKLLLVLGSVIALMLTAGVVAVVLLQSVLKDLEHFSTESFAGTSAAMAMQQQLADVQTDLERARVAAEPVDGPRLQSRVAGIQQELGRMGQLEVVRESAARQYANLTKVAAELGESVAVLSAAAAQEVLAYQRPLRAASDLRANLTLLQEALQTHSELEEQRTTSRFRWVALGLGLAFVLVINASIMVLARMNGMILKPVAQLVEASRRLAQEDFDCRVELDRQDEFGELAQAYNGLAIQLQANEKRKIETLHQVARTLNHELNNAIAIIQLQLDMASRPAQGGRIAAEPLREIQAALSRMAGIVSALTRIRRIVLTDYLSGVKMLDLEASVAEDAPDSRPTAALVHQSGAA